MLTVISSLGGVVIDRCRCDNVDYALSLRDDLRFAGFDVVVTRTARKGKE